ncbi:MAG: DNA-deoxyinosine glycosylase [Sideroxydans sp.]
MKHICSFPPVANSQATLLILGSMPGEESLKRQQYYAHPRNVFWRIMGELVGAPPTLPYPQRLKRLQESSIALWDVLHTCERTGSLDSAIEREKANDFSAFFDRHPRIMRIFFNGTKAEHSFRKFVLEKQQLPPLTLQRLPSTSPAHAGMCYAEKLERWRLILADAAC